MPIPESVKVTFTGKMGNHMDFRDVVHATQAQMLKQKVIFTFLKLNWIQRTNKKEIIKTNFIEINVKDSKLYL